MEPVPLHNCIQQLQSLSYSPILGNISMSQDTNQSQSQIPSFSNLPRARLGSVASVASSLNSGQQSPAPRKRLFSETSTSPVDVSTSKQLEMNQEQLDISINKI